MTEIADDAKNNYSKHFGHLKSLTRRCCNKWSSEYLTELRERQINEPVRAIKNGEIVLIKEDNLPRRQWRMGKVKKTLYRTSQPCEDVYEKF